MYRAGPRVLLPLVHICSLVCSAAWRRSANGQPRRNESRLGRDFCPAPGAQTHWRRADAQIEVTIGQSGGCRSRSGSEYAELPEIMSMRIMRRFVPKPSETVEKLGYQFEFSCWW
jgi:hypothetical protein